MDPHASGLFSTFVISLFAAFAGGLAARSVKLPPLLGYVLAGIIVGPFTPGFVANQAIADELASLGVTLLMFTIGLHFSVKDLLAVRRIALIGGAAQLVISFCIGSAVAHFLLDRTILSSMVIGLALSIASTAVSVRLLEDRHQITTFSGRVALGWLVLQDIVVIVALVLFPAISAGQGLSSVAVLGLFIKSLLQIAGFAAVMLLVGRRVIPAALGWVARGGSRELFTLAVIVMALGIAYGSSLLFGVSLALGAFFAGVVIGESDLSHHAASEALSMQQIFTILFFVSLGMLFDPRSLLDIPHQVAAAWCAIVFGMGLVTFLVLVALRVPLESAALVGAAFSQIGEFSFVLSELGVDSGLLQRQDRDLILGVGILSIALNPLIIAILPRIAKAVSGQGWVHRWYREGISSLPEKEQPLSGHVILVGHGRVGRLIAEGLETHKIPYVILESDRRLMEKLRHSGKPVVFGDASREAVLKAAHPETARLMILAVPDGAQARRIATHVRRQHPDLEMIARVHADNDMRAMAKLGVAVSVMGEREIALGLSAHALQRYDLKSADILSTLDRLRQEVQS